MAIAITTSSTDMTSSSLISINPAQITLKLTVTNYSSWQAQLNAHALLIGYDLLSYVDGSLPCPPKDITIEATEKSAAVTTRNPAYTFWIRQDKLLLSAIMGSVSLPLLQFIGSAPTSEHAWRTLAETYARPSRGCINLLKEDFRLITKGTRSITEFLQQVKAIADDLAFLGHPRDPEDIVLKVLNGIDDNDYKDLVSALRVRQSSVTFVELHERLTNFESHLKQEATKNSILPMMPAYANPSYRQSTNPYSKQQQRPSSSSPSYHQKQYPHKPAVPITPTDSQPTLSTKAIPWHLSTLPHLRSLRQSLSILLFCSIQQSALIRPSSSCRHATSLISRACCPIRC